MRRPSKRSKKKKEKKKKVTETASLVERVNFTDNTFAAGIYKLVIYNTFFKQTV